MSVFHLVQRPKYPECKIIPLSIISLRLYIKQFITIPDTSFTLFHYLPPFYPPTPTKFLLPVLSRDSSTVTSPLGSLHSLSLCSFRDSPVSKTVSLAVHGLCSHGSRTGSASSNRLTSIFRNSLSLSRDLSSSLSLRLGQVSSEISQIEIRTTLL